MKCLPSARATKPRALRIAYHRQPIKSDWGWSPNEQSDLIYIDIPTLNLYILLDQSKFKIVVQFVYIGEVRLLWNEVIQTAGEGPQMGK